MCIISKGGGGGDGIKTPTNFTNKAIACHKTGEY